MSGRSATVPLPELSVSQLDIRFEVDKAVLFLPSARHFPYIFLPAGQHTILGRSSLSSSQQPDVDLTLYAAQENGVSRLPAVIEWREDTLLLTDLDSANGTYLNDQRLRPQQPYPLHDRDTIRLGKLHLHLLFQSGRIGA